MKYYHIIYNSSEKPMEGGVGFGIRTATEGAPKELIKAINDINCFSDDWESYTDKPTPAKIKEDPSTIEAVPKNYAVTTITDEHGKSYSVIARRAYVGFDYGFYKNGMPTRTGNYVIDYYVFDSTPDSSAYEILYEKALPGSNHFIPMSVRPTEDNEEMREISVGAQPALPPTDKPFTAAVENALDKDVVKLFFTYLKSRQNGKKLVVKASREKALKLTADLYRMLDPESAKMLRVYVNHRSQGVKDNFDIFFIHEDYPHQIYPGLYDYIEIDSATMPDTDEARTFGKDMENLVKDSLKENSADIHDTLKWLMMPEYATVKLLSKPTIDAFFLYCIQPGNFTYDELKNGARMNDEFLKVLRDYTKKSGKNAERFKLVVKDRMNDATTGDVTGLIEDYNHLLKVGFDLDDVTKDIRKNISIQLLSDIGFFKKAIDKLGLKSIEKFFDKQVFESHNDYLDSTTLDPYMPELYRLFLTLPEQENLENTIYRRFLKRGIPKDIFHRIIDDVHGSNEDAKINFFTILLQKGFSNFKTSWPYLTHYLGRSSTSYDFLNTFSDRITNDEYAPMFHHSIIKNKKKYATPDKIGTVTQCLSVNPELKRLMQTNYKTDGFYDELYRNLDALSDKGPVKALEILQKDVVQVGIKDGKYTILEAYLLLKDPRNYAMLAGWNNPKLVKRVYDKIIEHSDKRMFDDLLLSFSELTSQGGLISPKELASQFRKFHPADECQTAGMLEKIVPYKDWVELTGTVLADVDKQPFKEAMELAKDFGMNDDNIDKLLTKFYEKDYNAYKRKNKIKNFFVSIGKIFKSKKKDKEEDKEEPAQTERKGIKPPKYEPGKSNGANPGRAVSRPSVNDTYSPNSKTSKPRKEK